LNTYRVHNGTMPLSTTVKLVYDELLGTNHFVRYKRGCYNRVNMCTNTINLTLKCVYYNREFVNNRGRYNLVSLSILLHLKIILLSSLSIFQIFPYFVNIQ
jgi:hypothetical protein